MERKRRRLFTVALTSGAVLVIVAAAASGLFQLAVQAVPGYRADVERYVRELTGRPVRIDALGLTWHYYYPSLELIGVSLLAEDGHTVLLQAERLRLGFGLTRLVRGDWRPNRLALIGLALDARIDRDGQVAVKGIEEASSQAGAPVDVLQPLTAFGQLRVQRCRLNLRDERRGNELYSFGIESAELTRGLLGNDLTADVALPATVGEAAHLDVSFTGEALAPQQWSGAGSLELNGLVPGFWLAPFLARGVKLDAAGADLVAEGRFVAGHLTVLDLRAQAGPVRAQRAGHTAAFESLKARVGVEVLKDGWRAELKHFALETPAGGAWPQGGGELKLTHATGAPDRWEGRADFLRLGDLAPWLQMAEVPAALAGFDSAAGELRELQFSAQGAGDDLQFAWRARFEQLALAARGRPAGFAGARGEVAGDERGGRAVFTEGPLTVMLPAILETPSVPFDSLEAALEWRHLEDGWRIAVPQLRWALLGIKGQGHFDLTLPSAQGASPDLDLSATFSSSDATRAKPLMPTHWGAGLRGWLDRAILSGAVASAQLEIHGPLADFPFVEKPTGAWNLDIAAQDLNLAYQPDWPPVEDFSATLHFRGNSLAIETKGGTVSGNPVQSASARFPDFSTGQLLVDGAVSGETSRYYEFLRNSPLRTIFRGLLEQTAGTGPSTVEVHHDIPVTHADDTQVRGKVTLEGVQLDYLGLEEPIRDIRGVVDFVPGKVSGEHLSGRLYELAIDGRLTPQPDRSTLLTAEFPFTVDAGGKGASVLVPAWVRRHVAGTSRWQARLPIGTDAPGVLTLTTDFSGVDVRLPAPLGKPAAQAVPLTVTIGSLPQSPLRITADYKDRFGADLRFARRAGVEALVFDRGALRVGGGPLIEATEKGVILGGQVDEVDARAWARELQGPGIEGQVQFIRRADLHVGRASWGRYALRDARYQWAVTKDGWTLSLTGAGGAGDVRWAGANRGTLSARMDSLGLDEVPVTPAGPEDEGVIDPNTMPLLDLDLRKLVVGATDLGHLTLATERTAAGQKLKVLHAEGGNITLSGDGEWRRRAGQSSGNFNADLQARDVAALLKAFGYTPNLDAKKAATRLALSWSPSETGLDPAQALGTVHLEFENGQLRAIDPGAGRVLGLVNFYALPRRLTLNFRDVVSSGLGFDKIQGDFELHDGSAHTQNLQINGPSLRMDVRGRIGLAARDYDQQVTVYPDVSSGVTLGALALGGPIAGVLTLIAQQILNKPLSKVTELSYRVTGSWDNPQVEKAKKP